MPRSFFPEREPLYSGGPLASKLWQDNWRRSRRASDVVLSGDETVSQATGDVTGLDVQGDALVMNNASLAVLHGLMIGGDRVQRIPILSIGAANVEIRHESATATVEAQRFHTSAGVTLRLLAGRGTAFVEYDNTSERYRVISHAQGGAIAQTFAAGEFTASSGTWGVAAGDVLRNHYTLTGRRLSVELLLDTTSVSATPASLVMTIPGGYTSAGRVRSIVELVDNGTPAAGVAEVTAGGTSITFTRLDGAAFAIAVNTTRVAGVVTCEVSA